MTIKDNKITIDPKWRNHRIAITTSSSEEYIPYLAVYLQSVTEHCSKENYYDIIVFSTTENETVKNNIIDTYSTDNISIRFINPEEYFQNVDLVVTRSYFHRASYYRLAAPNILRNYDKIIYTDIDQIAQDDYAKLYDIDLSNHPLAACIEPCWAMALKSPKYMKYTLQVLKLDNPQKYYNAGVLVFNVKNYIENNYLEKLLQLIKTNEFYFQEQDAINKLLNKEILPLSPEWNYELLKNLKYPKEITPKILHYTGEEKPWCNPATLYFDIWWEYAKKTSYYQQLKENFEKLKPRFLKKYNSKLYKYKILSKIAIGRKRNYYSDKLNLYIQYMKNLRNTLSIYIYGYILHNSIRFLFKEPDTSLFLQSEKL